MGCGICGFVGLSDKPLIRSMCDAIRHRGPDQTDFYVDEGVSLGIDRLKIIDLTTGDQPIHNEDGSVWVVFNGEIYNYRELRAELEQRGHKFYTSSDTETIVHAYETWGDDCVSHFRGMFALAVWEASKKRLFLARDRFGKKPLYYAQVGSVFLFASEIKSILEYQEVSRTIDLAAMDLFMTYMHIPSPHTIFEGIRKLPPANYMVYERGEIEIRRYWDMRFAASTTQSESAIIESLYRLIDEAVRIRLRSDVPLGAFLSGGVDSSTIVAMMAKMSEKKVKTVSIGFESGFSEVKYSRMVADILGTEHKEFTVSPSAFEVLPTLTRHFDEPFADHSMIPTYYLSKVTRGEVTVALSGDGGDELFMGYPFLVDPSSYGLYSKVPRAVRRPLLKLVSNLPGSAGLRRMANQAYEKDYGSQSAQERYAMRVSAMDRPELERLYSRQLKDEHTVSDTYQYMSELFSESGTKDVLASVDYATIRGYLEEGILTKVDRMSMAVSLEVRCPLLDHVLAEYVSTIPSSLKMNGRETKYIFKKMAVQKGLIPREIAYRKKQGFGAPLESWMLGDWRDITTQTLDPIVTRNYTGFFDADRVKHYLSDPYLYSNRLFALVMFAIWYGMYVEGSAPTKYAESAAAMP